MRLCDETITVFNAQLDTALGMDRYHPTVISGESGAVGMGLIAALMETDEYKDLRDAIGLDRYSQVLMFSTEGNTDPLKFRKVLWDGEFATV